MNRTVIYWTCQIVGWGLHGLLGYTTERIWAVSNGMWRPELLFVGAATGLVATHILRFEIRRAGWTHLSPAAIVPRMILGAWACSLTMSLVVSLVMSLVLGLFPLGKWSWPHFLAGAAVWTIPVTLWQVIYFGVHYYERLQHAELDRARLDTAAKDAQLRGLLAQLNPHFLFNSLNSLRALIIEDPARAQTMVTELAWILRYSLKAGNTHTVTLADEMEAVSSYLELEGIRLEERLRVKINIDPSVEDALLPPMLLQTLVENGVKHGISPLQKGGEIRLDARRDGDTLHIAVSNTGQLSICGPGTRIGLENARERLRLMFGPAASLALSNHDSNTVVAEVRLPYARAAH